MLADTHQKWNEVIQFAHRLSNASGPRCLLVAPDSRDPRLSSDSDSDWVTAAADLDLNLVAISISGSFLRPNRIQMESSPQFNDGRPWLGIKRC